jgi:hypothetical protein
MITPKASNAPLTVEPQTGRPVASAEQWLGRNVTSGRRLWERLNPRHRRHLLVLARALVLHQEKARLPEAARTRLLAALDELERLVARIEKLLVAVAIQTPPER